MRVKTNRICPGLLIDPTAGLSLFTRILRREYRELVLQFPSDKLFILSILISKILILILLKNHQIDTSSVEYRKIAIVFGLIKRVYLSYFASVSFWSEKFRTNEFDRSTLPPPSCLIQINTGTIKSIKTIKLWLFIFFKYSRYLCNNGG